MRMPEVKELYIERGALKIYGRLYLPKGESKEEKSLVILSHGFGSTYRTVEDYAEAFVRSGISAFAYDFTGGGNGSKSDGSTTDMSVLTEAADLFAVLDYFREEDGIDKERIFLFGASQGGFVSTYVAGKRPGDIAGMVLLYPAYVLQDDSRKRNPDPASGPDQTNFMGTEIGRIYDVDAQSFDIYEVMRHYEGDVLIIHGTADPIVPLTYSERAAITFPSAELLTIAGAGHGFHGDDRERAAKAAVSFVKKLE